MRLRSISVAAILAFLSATPAAAREAELLHADTPLWAAGDREVWPQHFVDGDSFGCVHSVKLGVWRYKAAGTEAGDSWYRLSNYGVFHCWMNVAEAFEPESFETSRPGFLIKLGQAGARELWALQIGARPGSDYILLARPAGRDRMDRFEVLQRECPKGQVRGGRSLDILLTRYCAINSAAQLVALAQRMAKLPILGTMTFESELPDESEAPAPSSAPDVATP